MTILRRWAVKHNKQTFVLNFPQKYSQWHFLPNECVLTLASQVFNIGALLNFTSENIDSGIIVKI